MALGAKPTHIAGPDLAAERVRRGVRAMEMARALGMSKQRISQVEHRFRVSPEIADRYMRALAELLAT